MQPTTPTTDQKPKQKPWRNPLYTFLAGLAVLFIVVQIVTILTATRSTTTRLSCHQPSQSTAEGEYCVYFVTKPGLIGERHQLVIGTSAKRGLVYQIPYDSKDVSVNWDNDSDSVSIRLPGSTLSITAGEYIDGR